MSGSRTLRDLICGPVWEEIFHLPAVQSKLAAVNSALRHPKTAESPFRHGQAVGKEEALLWIFKTLPEELKKEKENPDA